MITIMCDHDLRLGFCWNILQNIDKISHAAGVRFYMPFVSKGAFDAAAAVPSGYKVTKSSGKLVFRRAAMRALPEEICSRRKIGFETPVCRWMQQEAFILKIKEAFAGPAAQQFFREFGDAFKFDITQVIGLTNDDAVSKEFRPFKQMIERLNRTYKASYRSTNGFDNIEGANYDLALWVAYYNFLRPHKHAGNKVLNEVDLLKEADNMPGKWQLLIFLGQQTILNLQNQTTTA
jgi:hypothetical protein